MLYYFYFKNAKLRNFLESNKYQLKNIIINIFKTSLHGFFIMFRSSPNMQRGFANKNTDDMNTQGWFSYAYIGDTNTQGDFSNTWIDDTNTCEDFTNTRENVTNMRGGVTNTRAGFSYLWEEYLYTWNFSTYTWNFFNRLKKVFVNMLIALNINSFFEIMKESTQEEVLIKNWNF